MNNRSLKSPWLLVITSALIASTAFGAVSADAGNEAPPDAGLGPAGKGFDLPSKDSPEVAWWRKSMETRDERLAWWREARFGMFVHWGVYSALGNEYKGRRGGGYAEHIQRVLKIPIPEYRAEVASVFNPAEFDADEWIRLAKEAGMTYFVITAKHHDGFAMWPSKVGDYDIADATPFKRDPMAELRQACRKHGVKFGFYYSHAFDWGTENGPGNDWDYKNPGGDTLIGGRDWWLTTPAFLPKARQYVDEKAIPQLRELVGTYDPDIFWFDTPHKLPPIDNLKILKAVREASPRVVINGRLVRGWGDYLSTADRPAEFPPQQDDWEGIPTTNESYAWSKTDKSHKPTGHFVQLLVKAVARGGNLLMNIGPMGSGKFDPKDVEILQGIADWWKVNSESIHGAGRTVLTPQAWGESTMKSSGRIYLHVFEWPKNGKLAVGELKANVKKAYLLSDPKRSALKVASLGQSDLLIEVPKDAPDKIDSVVVLECAGEIIGGKSRLLQAGISADTLRVFDARLQGSRLRFGPGKKTDAYVTGWTDKQDAIVWKVHLNEPTTFEVEATYDAEAGAEGSTFAVKIGSETLSGTVKAGRQQATSLGRVTIKPASTEIILSAVDIKGGGEVMRPRTLTLKPVNP